MAGPDDMPLIGRAELVNALVRRVVRDDIALMTLHGRSGAGKTSVAVAVLGHLAGPRHRVSMRGVTDRHEYVARLGQALALSEVSERAMTRALGAEACVLLLDGSDADDVTRAVVEWTLAECPEVTVVVTASAPLGAAGERAFLIPPLPLPSGQETDPDVVAASPAVEMFVRRAEAASATFSPSDDDILRIAEVCARLDGLPGAIGIAAARIGTMQPETLLAEMANHGAWELVGLSIDDEVERTLKVLDARSMQVLFALATMFGGAGLGAVAAVAGVGAADAAADLTTLVDLQIARADPDAGRFELTSSAAAYLGPRLGDAPDWAELQRRHADHFAAAARRAGQRTNPTPMEGGWIADHHNRMAAVRWLRDQNDMRAALRLAVDSMVGFVYRGDVDAGRRMLGDVVRRCPPSTSGSYIQAHMWLGRLEAERGDGVQTEAAEWHFDMALQAARARGEAWIHVEVLNSIMENHALLDNGADIAERVVAEGLELAADEGLQILRSVFLCWHAGRMQRQRRSPEATSALAEAIDTAHAEADPRLLMSFGIMYWHLPADVRPARAGVPSLPELLEMAERLGDVRTAGWVLTVALENSLDDGDDVNAVQRCIEMIELAERTGQDHVARQGLFNTVRLLKQRDKVDARARLAGALSSRRNSIELSVRPEAADDFDRSVSEARLVAGADSFDTAFRDGEEFDLRRATELAAERLEALQLELSPKSSSAATPDPAEVLTQREREVLAGLALGRPNKEIAIELGMRPKTVAHHCAAIYQKLGVRNRTEAAAVAVGLPPD